MSRDVPRGVVGLGARQDVGVVATVGHRSDTGTPVDRHSWFFMSPLTAPVKFPSNQAQVRSPHPSFNEWNRKAKIAAEKAALAHKNRTRPDPNPHAIVRGNLIHGDWRHSGNYNFRAQKLRGKMPNDQPWGSPSSGRPACEGDGVKALRYFGTLPNGDEDFREVPCPGLLCEFQQESDGKRDCGSFAVLIFRLRWPENNYPSLTCRLQTGGYRSVESLLGLIESVLGTEKVRPDAPREEWIPGLAAELGIANPSLLGMPFAAEIGWKSSPKKNRLYPVIAFSADEDLVAWLIRQQEQARLAGGSLRALGPAPEPLPVVTAEIVDAAYTEVTAQGVPAEIVVAAGDGRHERAPKPGNGGADPRQAPGVGGVAERQQAGVGGAQDRQGPRVEAAHDAAQPSLDLPGRRVTLTGAQVQAIREEARTAGVSWDRFEEEFAGGPLAEYLGEPGETEKTLELRVLRSLRSRAGAA